MKVPMAPCWQLSLPVWWGFALLISHSHCLLDSWGMLFSSWQLSSFLESWSDLALIMYPTFSVFIWCKGKKKEENLGSLGWSHKSSWLYLHSLTHLRPPVSLWRVLWRGIGHKELRVDLTTSTVIRGPPPSDLWQLESCLDSFSVKPQDEKTALSLLDLRLASWGRDTQINYTYAVWLYPLNGNILFQREVYKTFRVHEVDWGGIWEYGWMFTYMNVVDSKSAVSPKGPAQHGWLLMEVTSLVLPRSLAAV